MYPYLFEKQQIPDILKFYSNKELTRNASLTPGYELVEASDVTEDEKKLKDAIRLVRTFAKNPSRTALTDSFIKFLNLLADTVESQKLTLEEAIKCTKEAVKTYRAEATYNFPELKEHYDNCLKCANQHDLLAEWLEELKSYKEAEEQGLLMKLPCKVGDDLYCIVNGEVKKLKVHSFGIPDFEITDIEFKYVDGFKIVRFVGEVGKTVFLTREEAEKKLEEMQNDKR